MFISSTNICLKNGIICTTKQGKRRWSFINISTKIFISVESTILGFPLDACVLLTWLLVDSFMKPLPLLSMDALITSEILMWRNGWTRTGSTIATIVITLFLNLKKYFFYDVLTTNINTDITNWIYLIESLAIDVIFLSDHFKTLSFMINSRIFNKSCGLIFTACSTFACIKKQCLYYIQQTMQ